MKNLGNEPINPTRIYKKELHEEDLKNPAYREIYDIYHGLTKREYFAGLALEGLLSGTTYDHQLRQLKSFVISEAIAYADALLNELTKAPKDD